MTVSKIRETLDFLEVTIAELREQVDAEEARAEGSGAHRARPMVAVSLTTPVGDSAPAEALKLQVAALLSDRPRTFAELLSMTGARRGRVSGAIVQLQRDGRRILNLGDRKRALWFLAAGTAQPIEAPGNLRAGSKRPKA